MKVEIESIGVVRNSKKEPCFPEAIKAERSVIRLDKDYRAGLLGLGQEKMIDVLFYLHKNDEVLLERTNRYGEYCGVFASRWPSRPNHIGVTRCRVLAVDKSEGEIVVEGLDAIDGSPVLDIKGVRMQ